MEKARCYVWRDKQVSATDYDPENVHAPEASYRYIHIPKSVTAVGVGSSNQIQLEGCDTSNGYLYGKLDVPIIMEKRTNSTQKEAVSR